MKPMRNMMIRLFSIPLFILWVHCIENNPDNVAGGLETTNGIIITVANGTITGATVAETRIIVCDTMNEPPEIGRHYFIDTIFSNQKGEFTISGLPQGTYTLVTQNTDLNSGCLIRPINVDYDGTTTSEDTAVFVPLSAIPVQTRTDSAVAPKCIVFIPGTPFQILTGETGTGILTGIPSGTYRVNAYLNKPKDPTPFIYTSTIDDVHVTDSTATLTILLTS